jgi:hypothetical protein
MIHLLSISTPTEINFNPEEYFMKSLATILTEKDLWIG